MLPPNPRKIGEWVTISVVVVIAIFVVIMLFVNFVSAPKSDNSVLPSAPALPAGRPANSAAGN
ncbi:MAG: hypothetical protein V1928_02175 [Parcubacteria group bacterium]